MTFWTKPISIRNKSLDKGFTVYSNIYSFHLVHPELDMLTPDIKCSI